MAETSKFFNSTENDRRLYSSADFAEYMATFFSTGVVGESSLKVQPGSACVNVTTGKAIINGYQYISDSVKTFLYDRASNGGRYDRVVLQLDLNNDKRHIKQVYLTGSSKPPTLTLNDNICEFPLALIKIAENSSVIESITDERIFSMGLFSADLSEFREKAEAAVNLITKLSNEELLNKIKQIHGENSGISADMLDGFHGSYYSNYQNLENKPKIPESSSGSFAPKFYFGSQAATITNVAGRFEKIGTTARCSASFRIVNSNSSGKCRVTIPHSCFAFKVDSYENEIVGQWYSTHGGGTNLTSGVLVNIGGSFLLTCGTRWALAYGSDDIYPDVTLTINCNAK